ncbi:MAG: hypothetical protein ACRD0N_02200 [Acidimicrobiales bacterium]
MEAQAEALARAVDDALPGWVERSVEARLRSAFGHADPAAMVEAHRAGEQARAEVGGRVRALLARDIDDQRANPLAILRTAVHYPTAVLRAAGTPPVPRDDFAVDRFPDDVYDLMPASFADIDPALAVPGIEWGAAKAWAHMRRHGGPSRGGPER